MDGDHPQAHRWDKVPPVVVVIGDPLAREKGGKTYNAECPVCGERRWLHWHRTSELET